MTPESVISFNKKTGGWKLDNSISDAVNFNPSNGKGYTDTFPTSLQQAISASNWKKALEFLSKFPMSKILDDLDPFPNIIIDELYKEFTHEFFEQSDNKLEFDTNTRSNINLALFTIKEGILPKLSVEAFGENLLQSGKVFIAADYLAKRFEPIAKKRNAKDSRRHISLLLIACGYFNVIDKSHVAYILATAHHEAWMGACIPYKNVIRNWMFEIPWNQQKDQSEEDYFNHKYANINGNGDENTKDGYKYRGRGYVHLTGRDNYKRFCTNKRQPMLTAFWKNYSEVNLETEPDLAAEPLIAMSIIVYGMKYGIYTQDKENENKGLAGYGKDGGDGVKEFTYHFKNARQIINGNDKDQEIAEIAMDYRRRMNRHK